MTYHFIGSPEIAEFFKETAGHDGAACIDAEHHRFTNSAWAWVAQTALLLRDTGLPISVGTALRPDAVNLGLAADLRRLSRTADYFRVSIDADQLRARWSNAFIVQNQAQAGRRAFWVPHWPQPGLLERDPQRRRLENVVFFGLARNLGRDEAWWKDVCRQFGMQFEVRPSTQWHDYRDVDVAVGIRRFGHKRFSNKPPTKLFNAWLAGAVFVGGADSAYRQVGVAGRDHLVATNEYELLEQLGRLTREPKLAKKIISEGRRRVDKLGCRLRTCDRWAALLEQEIRVAFETWKESAPAARRLQIQAGLVMDEGVLLRNRWWRRAKQLRNGLS